MRADASSSSAFALKIFFETVSEAVCFRCPLCCHELTATALLCNIGSHSHVRFCPPHVLQAVHDLRAPSGHQVAAAFCLLVKGLTLCRVAGISSGNVMGRMSLNLYEQAADDAQKPGCASAQNLLAASTADMEASTPHSATAWVLAPQGARASAAAQQLADAVAQVYPAVQLLPVSKKVCCCTAFSELQGMLYPLVAAASHSELYGH